MLSYFHTIARAIAPYMVLAWLVLFGSIALFVWTLATSTTEAQDSLMLLAATSCAWSIGLIVLRSHFYVLPAPPDPDAGFVRRWRATLSRFLSWCLAIAMTLCTMALLLMSYKAVSYYLST